MAARSLWNGAIRFGLVNVPIKVYGAAQSQQIQFRELHEKDAAPVQHRRVCSKEDHEVPSPQKKAGDREAKMADALISSLEAGFDPADYEDTYRERVLEVVQAKAKGEQIVVAEPAKDGAGPDLMALLEQSLEGAKKKQRKPARK